MSRCPIAKESGESGCHNVVDSCSYVRRPEDIGLFSKLPPPFHTAPNRNLHLSLTAASDMWKILVLREFGSDNVFE
ncbi:hypothetical protein IG631_17011 [Alternaria alternata]|nr:hypothetical protein IG631_17011 [Alternaria alternata]